VNDSRTLSGMRLWPRSIAGRAGVALTALFLVVLGVNLLTANGSGQNEPLVFATFLAALGAVASLILSVVAIVRQRERALLVFLPVVVGALVSVFLIIEVLSGHD